MHHSETRELNLILKSVHWFLSDEVITLQNFSKSKNLIDQNLDEGNYGYIILNRSKSLLTADIYLRVLSNPSFKSKIPLD